MLESSDIYNMSEAEPWNPHDTERAASAVFQVNELQEYTYFHEGLIELRNSVQVAGDEVTMMEYPKKKCITIVEFRCNESMN